MRLESLEWTRQLDIAVCMALGWRAMPEPGSQVQAYGTGWRLENDQGQTVGWYLTEEDAWAEGADPLTMRLDLAISLAARQLIAMKPFIPRGDRTLWCARWLAEEGDAWQLSASLPIAVCLAVLRRCGVAPPPGNPETTTASRVQAARS